jgi:hypothetical protein
MNGCINVRRDGRGESWGPKNRMQSRGGTFARIEADSSAITFLRNRPPARACRFALTANRKILLFYFVEPPLSVS